MKEPRTGVARAQQVLGGGLVRRTRPPPHPRSAGAVSLGLCGRERDTKEGETRTLS